MKITLLQVVQNYLNRTDGFYVNSIFETDESQQVADIAEEVFYILYSIYRNVEFTQTIRTLNAVSDVDRPNYLRIPDEVHRVQDSQVYYDIADTNDTGVLNYKKLTYLTPEDFMNYTAQMSIKTTTEDFIVVEDFNRTKFPVQTNKQPEFYTSFDGEYIVFDSYDKELDTTLQESKSRVFVSEEPVFLIQDDFVIDVPYEISQLYKDMVLVECYQSLRQEPAPPVVEKRARTGWIKLQQEARRIGSAGRKQKFGRRGNRYGVQTRHNSCW